jgi:hypothetical protein
MSTDPVVLIPDSMTAAIGEAAPASFSAEAVDRMARASASADLEDADEDLELRPMSVTEWIRGGSACFISTAFHILALVALGLIGLDNASKAEVQTILAAPVVERPEDEPVEIELNQEIQVVESSSVSMSSSAPAIAGVGTGPAATVGTPTLDQQVVSESAVASNIAIEAPTVGMPSATKFRTAK